MKKLKIGVFGHYGNKNLGDEAIIEAAIQNLKKRLPNAELIGMSINPDDTAARYGIPTFPIRYKRQFFDNKPSADTPAQQQPKNVSQQESQPVGEKSTKDKLKKFWPIKITFAIASKTLRLLSSFRTELFFLGKCKEFIKDIDMIIVCGSNQFLDNFGGSWGFPYTLAKWTYLAKKNGTKVVFLSIGAGPLEKPLSFWMLSKTLTKADYVSYRDEGSKALVESRINIDAPVFPDIAHSLLMSPSSSESTFDRPVLALNPMPVFDSRYWYKSEPAKYQKYVADLCQFIKHVHDSGYQVRIFNTQIKDLVVVDDVLEKIKELGLSDKELDIVTHHQLNELIDTMAQADIIVATRFHATVLPLRLGKPVIGICYYRKAAELLSDVGLGEFHVDIHDFSAKQLIDQFDNMVSNREQLVRGVNDTYTQYKTQLDKQWDKVVGLLK